MSHVDSNPNERPSPKDENRFRREEEGPITVDPFDFGEAPKTVIRALELNRQLLYESWQGVQCDREAVQDKIDELLDRLIRVRGVRREAPKADGARRRNVPQR